MPFDPEVILSTLALCADPGTWTVMLAGLTSRSGIAGTLFVAGLISGFTHCSGMCGPFVLMRIVARERAPGTGTILGQLGRSALWPYHLGRAVTYSALGAVAASAMGAMFDWFGFRWAVAAILVAVTTFMVVAALQASGFIGRPGTTSWGRVVPGAVTALAGRAAPLGDFPFGLALGLLPCGIVYGALAAAASTGSAIDGALAMSAFALGTFPGLLAVGFGGAFFARRLRGARVVVLPLAAVNIAIATTFVLKAVG